MGVGLYMLMGKWQGHVPEEHVRWMMFLHLEDAICCSPPSGHYDLHPSHMKTTLIPSLKNLRVSLHYGIRLKSRIYQVKVRMKLLDTDSWILLSKYSSSQSEDLSLKRHVI